MPQLGFFVRITLKFTKIEKTKRIRQKRWGISNIKGTYNGKVMIEGKRTVMRGTDKIRLDGLRLNNNNMSFALNMIIIDITKRIHSRAILVTLSTLMPRPYMSRDTGHNNCVPPVRKSPTRLCWSTATKQGTALFLYSKKTGIKRRQKTSTE